MSTAKKWVLGGLLTLGAGGTLIGGCDSIAFHLNGLGAAMIFVAFGIVLVGVQAIEF